MKTVAYLAGTSFCGSTLLALIMNSHPNILSVGEMGPDARFEGEEFLCSCGSKLAECSFFLAVADEMAHEGVPLNLTKWQLRHQFSNHQSIERLVRGSSRIRRLDLVRDRLCLWIPSYRRYAQNVNRRTLAFIHAALRVSGKEVLFDATKMPSRIEDLRRMEGVNLKVIHLVRDPRGFCNSARKNHGQSVRRVARIWVNTNADLQRRIAGLPSEAHTRVRYESLCRDPVGVFDELATFFGAEHCQLPEDFWRHPHHIIGNRMRLSAREPMTIRADTSWESELSQLDRDTVADVAGNLASTYGYEV